jgi:hypothetical protein
MFSGYRFIQPKAAGSSPAGRIKNVVVSQHFKSQACPKLVLVECFLPENPNLEFSNASLYAMIQAFS